ncbi:unnamed protein product, partial [Brenthis ino]
MLTSVDTEYGRMPPKYSLDDYNKCLKKPSGRYCTVNFELVSDTPNELLYMIQEYSKASITHFNHTRLKYGICVSENCQRYKENITVVSESVLEGCLNDSLWSKYELKTRVIHHKCFSLTDAQTDITTADVIVAVILGLILILNIVGSIFDYFKLKIFGDKSVLLCFSITRNLKRLTWIQTSEPRLTRLKGLNGLKCIILAGITLTHCIWPFLTIAENIRGLELAYYDLSQYILFNGALVIQAYLVMSGFLLSYKIQIYAETQDLEWIVVLKGIFVRYLRITPSWAVLIALWATWARFIGPGPLWEESSAGNVADCSARWWASLLYINNFVKNSLCMMHTWYLAADMQLYIFGLIVCVFLKKPGYKRVVLVSLLVIGLIIPAVHIYVQDLDAVLLITLERTKELFVNDLTFNELNRRSHTNIANYVIGMALGYLVYRWQDLDVRKYKKFRILYWLTLPVGAILLLSGRIFYMDAPREDVWIRVLYGTFSKLIIGLLFAVLIGGTVLKYEGFYRWFLEWRLWTIPGRLSYSAFLLHFSLITLYTSIHTTLKTMGPYDLYIFFICIMLATYAISLPLWLLVEAPFTELTRYIYSSEPKKKEMEEKNNEVFIIKL